MKLPWSSFRFTKSVWINRSKLLPSSILTFRLTSRLLTLATMAALKTWITQLAPLMLRNKSCQKPLWSRLKRRRGPLFISKVLFKPSWVSGILELVASIKCWSTSALKTQMRQRFSKVTKQSLYLTMWGRTSLLFRPKSPQMSLLRDFKVQKWQKQSWLKKLMARILKSINCLTSKLHNKSWRKLGICLATNSSSLKKTLWISNRP